MSIKKQVKKIMCSISPELVSKYLFRSMLGQHLDLRKPQGLNAKITWLKLNTYRDNPLVTRCSDKYAVRNYVSECGFTEILNELYGVWEDVENICWDALPQSFVLKCNHGCGYNILCPEKELADREKIIAKLKKWMEDDYWAVFAELQYRTIPKRIICEKYLGDSLIDYKFYCFNGKPLYVLTCIGRIDGKHSHESGYDDPKFYFLDKEWRICPLTRDSINCSSDFSIPRPDNLDRMWEISEKLCMPFPFVRVDLYDVNGRVIFGELTFTPSAGLDTGRLLETDVLFGNCLLLAE
ncbi:ATP-grasp fold amidoligase family protein [Butyrivibrio sp. TB]|uniref:ATP-grasp fold amidoligase family protein n=1 Tax=Butyrivibrio sp. TB TaxID=1520809 RepID=UPI0008C6C843|nr:ATP-grasp fold amidoligase family protein [Butyrivibrio sp. TB]SEP83396.1 TupA-like ATPgrasp [Butyrivibrio sp. TB]